MSITHSVEMIGSTMKIPIILFENDIKKNKIDLKVSQKLKNVIDENILFVKSNIKKNLITQLTDFSSLSYIGLSLGDSEVVIGPFLLQELSSDVVVSLNKRLRTIAEDSKLNELFYSTLQILSPSELEWICTILYSDLSTTTFEYKQLEAKKVKRVRNEPFYEELEYVYHNYKVEKEFTDIIRNGDVAKILEFPTREIMKQLPERARNDSLRNAKTRLTILNTLSNRAAIRGGIDVQLGHKISTNFGIEIEELSSLFDIDHLSKRILTTYTNAVKNYRVGPYPKTIRNAIRLIRQNITESYTLTDLASDLFISKEHLSRQFKKETGETVSKYINVSKITEAKILLEEQQYTIQDISDILSYPSSSYFSTVFKNIVGMTPTAYLKAKKVER